MTLEQIERILKTAPVGSNAWVAAMQAKARLEGKGYRRVTVTPVQHLGS